MRRTLVGIVVALALLFGAQRVRDAAALQRALWPDLAAAPYAPSPAAAPFVTAGYRELAADLLWIRAKVYFAEMDDTAEGLRGLIDAIVTLDPQLYKAYEFGARAIQWVDGGHTIDDILWSTELLRRGIAEFPEAWKLPYLLGQILVFDLGEMKDERASAWRAEGLAVLDRAIRMKGAPRNLARAIASLRTEMGQLERAVRDLEELIASTDDDRVRRQLIEKLAELQDESADQIADEMEAARAEVHERWKAALPEADLEMYLLLGDPPAPYIDLGELAQGGALTGADDAYDLAD